MAKILPIFILVPVVEIVLLMELGRQIGFLATLAVIISTGCLGACLVRSQGLAVLRQIRAAISEGRLPSVLLVDSVIILLAALVLLTPGILTDVIGFLCLIPTIRRSLKAIFWRRLKQVIQKSQVQVSMNL